MKRRLLVTGIAMAFVIGLLLLRFKPVEERGLFSWSSSVLEEEERQELFKIMKNLKINVLYQAVSDDIEEVVVGEFLKEAGKNGIEVWLLTGDPSWGLDPEGERMIQEVERAARFTGFRGILMDCEPYLTEEWEADADGVMESWLSAMQNTHKEAEKKGLRLSACIPYYLDTEGFGEELEELVRDGCDALSIMNYYKENEAKHIRTEVEIAQQQGVPVTVIYELQAPGKHGLKEINTYYNDGLEAVENSFQVLQDELGVEGLSPALHEYNSLRELLAED